MTQPKLLLLSPAFHGYWKAIQASLEVHGYEVRTHIYDAPGTLPERILNKLAHELPEKYRPESFAAQATRKAIDAFNEFRPDIVLVIKGDMLSREWWDLLETSGVRYGTWLYDEMRRMSYTEEDLHHLGSLASYSPLDAQHLREQGYADDAFFEEVAESAQQVANGVREAVLNSEVADFEYFFDRVYVQEHQQVEDDREFYRNYVAGFEEE